jgi:hypothetical protein
MTHCHLPAVPTQRGLFSWLQVQHLPHHLTAIMVWPFSVLSDHDAAEQPVADTIPTTWALEFGLNA